MKIGCITTAGLGGGGTYTRMAFSALSKKHDVEAFDLVHDKGGRSIAELNMWYWLLRLRGHKDVWIRDFESLITLPLDRTSGKNLALIHHVDHAHSSLRLPIRLVYVWIYEKAFYWNLRKVDAIVTVSKYWQDYFLNRGYRNVYRIYNAFDPREFQLSEYEVQGFKQQYGMTDKPIIYIGNCQKSKGVVEAYEQLKEMDAYLVTSGARTVELPAVNLDLSYREYLLLLKASSVAVLMSKFKEGWNRTAHEAMLCRTPVVGSEKGGRRELLEGGGQIICPQFSQLRDCVEMAMSTPGLGDKGYQYAKGFTVERFEEEWNQLLEERLGGGEIR